MTEGTYQAVKDTAESMPKGRRFSVRGVLNKLGVSASGYYDWLKREPSEQERRKQRIKELIKKIHADSHFIYGAPKITQILRGMGEKISERTVSIYMKELGIRACWVKPYTVTTISKDFSDKLKNVLKREFDPNEPNAVWCTDITYLWTDEGFLYLSCIMDLFSRRIIAWELSRTLETEHVIRAIEKAEFRNIGVKPKIIHTDRGVQYTSDLYRNYLTGVELSYSGKGNPWDNACIESFHALIKREWLNRFRIRDYDHAYNLVFEYIDAFYNTRRIHSHCNYLSPFEYEKNYYRQIIKAAA
ncbi:MAG: IS3 family transposase [Agathobacter sp.]